MATKVKSEKRIKKPMNSFFYYRRDIKDKIVKEYGSIASHDVSKIASECWKNESVEVKEYYKRLSKQAHEEHKANHPNFEWQPWKKKSTPTDDAPSESIPESSMPLQDLESPPKKPILPKLTLTIPQEGYNLSKISPDVLASTLLDTDELYFNSDNTVTFKPKSPTFQIAASVEGFLENPYDPVVLSPHSECSIYSYQNNDNPYD
ncbi:hypothetical protein HDV01_004691 [Terramyces sp. JEL0728]|nr:hypothetical protein HDV01_004691 [Terramyces sp. JEL0728]